MNFSCVICSDLFQPSDDVFGTPCGHLFHFQCVTQWFERSPSCPQCRAKVTQNRIFRIYFNLTNTDSIKDDPAALQEQIDKQKFQLLLLKKDVDHYANETLTHKKQARGLREEVKKRESEITSLKSAQFALKDQVKFFSEQTSTLEAAKKEVIRLRKKLDECQTIQRLLDSTAEDVDDIVSNVRDPSILQTYISVMKREIDKNLAMRKELRNRLKAIQQELTKVSLERNYLSEESEKRKHLEEDFAHSQREIKSLQCKIRELQKARASGSSKRDSDFERFIAESPAPKKRTDSERFNATSSVVTKEDEITNDDSVISVKSEEMNKTTGDEENSPYPRVKPQGTAGLSKRSLSSKPSSQWMLAKKPRLTQSSHSNVESPEITYDGFGGHSKADIFPHYTAGFKMTKTKGNVRVMKGRRQKKNADGPRTLDGFLVDLT